MIACDSKANPAPNTDATDYLTLAQTAKEKIQVEFASLINDGSNLRRVGDVTDGSAIMTYLKGIKQDKDTTITQKDSKETIDGFLEVLKTQIFKISNNLVVNYPELIPLFNGINPNDILKINTNDLDNLLTNKVFNWKSSDFGISKFNIDDYNVTEWYHLTANLTLDFTCLDENAKVNTTTINQTYDMYFANEGSDLNKLVNFITNDVKRKLDAQKVAEVKYTGNNLFDDSFINKKTDILEKIKTNFKKIVPKVVITTTQLTNLKDYHYMNRWGVFNNNDDNIDFNPLTMTNVQDHLSSKIDFDNAWKTPVDNRLNDFKTVLDKWIIDNKLTIPQQDQDKIFVIGNYETTNWSIDGLELKTITIPYYVISDKTRVEDTQDSLDIVDKLFVGTNSLFNYPNNISGNGNTFNFNISPTDFDNFVSRDVSLQEIYEYMTNKTKNFLKLGIKENIAWVNSNMKYSTQAKISNTPNLEITNNHIYATRGWTYLWRLNINGNAFGFSFNNQPKGQESTVFSITSSKDATWPS